MYTKIIEHTFLREGVLRLKKVLKGYKFRLYPNKIQSELINKTIGCSRFVANFVMGQQKREEDVWKTVNELVQNGMLPENTYKSSFFKKNDAIKEIPLLKKHYEWLKEVDSIALQSSVENVGDAYKRYYDKIAQKPKFKSKKNPVQSYTTKMVNGNIGIFDKHIKLPKLGLIRYANSKKIEGKMKKATIRRTPSGNYYISLLVETMVSELPKTNSSVGVDVGLKYFAILSNGHFYENPKFFCSMEEKLAKAQRILSKRAEGSSNWYKQKVKVARIHETIFNARKDYLQKISTEIIKNHDVIGLEDLKVSNMVRNHNLAKAITEVSWAEFRTMLEYKAAWYGKQVVAVDPKHTSQRCYACGHTEKANRQSQSAFVCLKCGHAENADINASKNIEERALAV